MQTEHVLSTDNFKQPKVLTGKEAIGTLLVRLILFEPGTDPCRPEMGVGLVSRYRYKTQDDLQELRNRISDQVATYLPNFRAVDVTLELKSDGVLDISIEIDGTLYKYETVVEKDRVVALNELGVVSNS